jgi:hypothetical protein
LACHSHTNSFTTVLGSELRRRRFRLVAGVWLWRRRLACGRAAVRCASGIFPENIASLALHEAAGFRIVGIRERIGQHHGRWRDVVLLERRSPAI